MKKRKSDIAKLDFKAAFHYPFNRAKGMWNILWILVPIIGWLALTGYGVRIIQEFCEGKFKQLPVFQFKKDLKLGFFMFLKAIPFILVCIVIFSILSLLKLGYINTLMGIFIIPILTINFIKKMTISSFFEFKILKFVFIHFGDYIVAVLKSILLAIVFVIMIIILVGLPALFFTKNMFLADFYRRRIKIISKGKK